MSNIGKPAVRVRAMTPRYSFDGQTGIVAVEGTLGTVIDMTLSRAESLSRKPYPDPIPTLTVQWDLAVVQNGNNDDFDTVTSWEENRIQLNEVEFVAKAIQ